MFFSERLRVYWVLVFENCYREQIFENTNNTILMLSEKCYCYKKLMFFVFFQNKKLRTKQVLIFLILFIFYNTKHFSKILIK